MNLEQSLERAKINLQVFADRLISQVLLAPTLLVMREDGSLKREIHPRGAERIAAVKKPEGGVFFADTKAVVIDFDILGECSIRDEPLLKSEFLVR